jgi:hypothetical protein
MKEIYYFEAVQGKQNLYSLLLRQFSTTGNDLKTGLLGLQQGVFWAEVADDFNQMRLNDNENTKCALRA